MRLKKIAQFTGFIFILIALVQNYLEKIGFVYRLRIIIDMTILIACVGILLFLYFFKARLVGKFIKSHCDDSIGSVLVPPLIDESGCYGEATDGCGHGSSPPF